MEQCSSQAGTTSDTQNTSAAECCASFYEQDWVQKILGPSFHPGGRAGSKRLLHSLKLPPSSRVLDVACGIGTTTLMMAQGFHFASVGVDLSQANLDKAIIASSQMPVGCATFHQGSAEALPIEDKSCDALVCECAVSTFIDQPKVLSEFHRVLKPGGVVGISDMVVNGELPEEISEHIAPWTCMTHAQSMGGYQRLFESAGFTVLQQDDETHTLLELITQLKKALLMASVGKSLGSMSGLPIEVSVLRNLLAQAKELATSGTVGYCRMVFSKRR